MTRTVWLVPMATLVLCGIGCRQIAGIGPISYSDSGSQGDAGCPIGTPLYTTASIYNVIAAQNGFLYVDVPLSGVARCPVGGCTNPTQLVSSTMYEAYALSTSSLYYTISGSGSNGSVHKTGLDGTSDVAIASNLANPFWIAVTGTNVFWIDDSLSANPPTGTSATVNCIGCSGTTSVPWINNLFQTYAIVADANNVWVLEDDGTLSNDNVIVCSTKAACLGKPDGGATAAKVVVSQILPPISSGTNTTGTPNFMAGDGTYLYVVGASGIVRTDASGVNKTVVPGVQNLYAIALDGAGNLYYATDTTIYRTKADGSSASTTVVCNQTGITALAVDATSVYFLTGGISTTNGAPNVAPK